MGALKMSRVTALAQLTADQVSEMWYMLEPIMKASCASNEISADDITHEDIFMLLQTGDAIMFAAVDVDRTPALAVVLQFHVVNGKKGVDVIAMGGRDLLRLGTKYWSQIKKWLKANDVVFIDAYANPRLAKVYLKKLGFQKACVYVRTIL